MTLGSVGEINSSGRAGRKKRERRRKNKMKLERDASLFCLYLKAKETVLRAENLGKPERTDSGFWFQWNQYIKDS